MRKKLMCILMVAAMMLTATACGSKEENSGADSSTIDKKAQTESSTTAEATGTFTLGDYKNLTVSVSADEPNEENIVLLLNDIYISYCDKDNGGITDRAVATGDTVVIDYEGKKDGVAFSGGTATGADLTIGSGQFIDGFEDGLVGVMPGETVDLDLTFPENYGNAELAGQAVVFTVTVQYIRPTVVAMEDMDDAVAATIGSLVLGDESINTIPAVYDYIEQYLEYQYTSELENAIINEIMNATTFGALDQSEVDKYTKIISDYFGLDTFEETYGYSADDYFSYYYGTTADVYVNAAAENAVKQNMVIKAIAENEGLVISDEELQEKLAEYMAEEGIETLEEFLGDNTEEDWRDSILSEKVIEYLKEVVNVQ